MEASGSVNVEEIKLTQLLEAYKGALEEKKYSIFFDGSGGNAATFFHYKNKLRDFNKEIMKINNGN